MKTTKKLHEFKAYCISQQIPIISDEARDYIIHLIQTYDIKNMLEIGSGIGYSAISFSRTGIQVDSIEIDEARVKEAKEWVKHFDARVTIIHADAKKYIPPSAPYDLIFIDGPKAQYQFLFDTYTTYLSLNGFMICDNLDFHGLTMNDTQNRGTRNLLKKLSAFKTYVINHPHFDTQILRIGDGLSISSRKAL